MFTVYVLFSRKFGKIYVGFTSNLAERLKAHNELDTKGWTRSYRPWEVIHQELFENKAAAMQREKDLKSGQGRQWIWRKLVGRE